MAERPILTLMNKNHPGQHSVSGVVLRMNYLPRPSAVFGDNKDILDLGLASEHEEMGTVERRDSECLNEWSQFLCTNGSNILPVFAPVVGDFDSSLDGGYLVRRGNSGTRVSVANNNYTVYGVPEGEGAYSAGRDVALPGLTAIIGRKQKPAGARSVADLLIHKRNIQQHFAVDILMFCFPCRPAIAGT